jgi:hypothetical protein
MYIALSKAPAEATGFSGMLLRTTCRAGKRENMVRFSYNCRALWNLIVSCTLSEGRLAYRFLYTGRVAFNCAVHWGPPPGPHSYRKSITYPESNIIIHFVKLDPKGRNAVGSSYGHLVRRLSEITWCAVVVAVVRGTMLLDLSARDTFLWRLPSVTIYLHREGHLQIPRFTAGHRSAQIL